MRCGVLVGMSPSGVALGTVPRQRGSKTLLWYVAVHGVSYRSLTSSKYYNSILQRDNVLFGQPWDEEKYWKVIENASLLADLDMLPAADLTEVRFLFHLPNSMLILI